MMKPGIKLLFIALSCLTLASGCTKKKTNNSSKAPEKAAAKTDTTGPIKTDPAPAAPAAPANDDSETPSPAALTPAPAAPAADPSKAAPPAKVTTPPASGATTTVPQATVTPKPEQKPQSKSDVEIFEECVSPLVTSLLSIEREKSAEVIEAKKLFETKLEILKKCTKPASVTVDFAETLVTKKIIDFAEVKFIDAEGNVDAFYEIERQSLPETERRKIYEQVSAEMKAAQMPQTSTTTPPPAPTTVPVPVLTPAPTTAPIVPQTATVPTPSQPTNTPPTAAAAPAAKSATMPAPVVATKPPTPTPQPSAIAPTVTVAAPKPTPQTAAAPAPAQQKAEPVKATSSSASGSSSAAAATPASGAKPEKAKEVAKDTKIVADFKVCFNEIAIKGIDGFKTVKQEVISPRDIYEIKLSASSICDFEATKEPKLDDYMTKLMVDKLNKDFPKSSASTKFFAETEKQKLAIIAKRAVYDKFSKEAKIASKFDKPAVSTAAAPAKDATTSDAKNQDSKGQDLKDIAALEACLNTTLDPIMKSAQAEKSKIVNPIQLYSLQKMVTNKCKIEENEKVKATRNASITKKTLAIFPDSKEIVSFYSAVEKMTNNEELKLTLYRYYGGSLEISEKNSMLAGTIEASQTTGNVITYTLKQLGGEVVTKAQAPGKDPETISNSLDKIQPSGINFVFDFTMKENKTGTLTIMRGQSSFPIDFAIAKGDLAQLKAKQSINIVLTQASWTKLWELKLRQNMGISTAMAPTFPLKFKLEAAKGTLPICELSSTELKCADPDVSVKLKVNTEALVTQ